MDYKLIFSFIKASKFFPKYAPAVKTWGNKLSGKSRRGKPLTFSEHDLFHIKAGIEKFYADIKSPD